MTTSAFGGNVMFIDGMWHDIYRLCMDVTRS